MSIAEQDQRLRVMWPAFRGTLVGERLAVWRGPLQGLSHPYEIEIVYALNRSWDPFMYAYAPFPEVSVIDPPLAQREEAPDDPIPHLYRDPSRNRPVLCLFDPRVGGWASGEAIADTIIPWAASWLRFYEAWHATGIWTGGGASHAPPPGVPSDAAHEDPALHPQLDAPNHTPAFVRWLLTTICLDALLAGLAAMSWQIGLARLRGPAATVYAEPLGAA